MGNRRMENPSQYCHFDFMHWAGKHAERTNERTNAWKKNKVETNNKNNNASIYVVCSYMCVSLSVYSSNQRIHPHVDYTNSKIDTHTVCVVCYVI